MRSAILEKNMPILNRLKLSVDGLKPISLEELREKLFNQIDGLKDKLAEHDRVFKLKSESPKASPVFTKFKEIGATVLKQAQAAIGAEERYALEVSGEKELKKRELAMMHEAASLAIEALVMSIKSYLSQGVLIVQINAARQIAPGSDYFDITSLTPLEWAAEVIALKHKIAAVYPPSKYPRLHQRFLDSINMIPSPVAHKEAKLATVDAAPPLAMLGSGLVHARERSLTEGAMTSIPAIVSATTVLPVAQPLLLLRVDLIDQLDDLYRELEAELKTWWDNRALRQKGEVINQQIIEVDAERYARIQKVAASIKTYLSGDSTKNLTPKQWQAECEIIRKEILNFAPSVRRILANGIPSYRLMGAIKVPSYESKLSPEQKSSSSSLLDNYFGNLEKKRLRRLQKERERKILTSATVDATSVAVTAVLNGATNTIPKSDLGSLLERVTTLLSSLDNSSCLSFLFFSKRISAKKDFLRNLKTVLNDNVGEDLQAAVRELLVKTKAQSNYSSIVAGRESRVRALIQTIDLSLVEVKPVADPYVPAVTSVMN